MDQQPDSKSPETKTSTAPGLESPKPGESVATVPGDRIMSNLLDLSADARRLAVHSESASAVSPFARRDSTAGSISPVPPERKSSELAASGIERVGRKSEPEQSSATAPTDLTGKVAVARSLGMTPEQIVVGYTSPKLAVNRPPSVIENGIAGGARDLQPKAQEPSSPFGRNLAIPTGLTGLAGGASDVGRLVSPGRNLVPGVPGATDSVLPRWERIKVDVSGRSGLDAIKAESERIRSVETKVEVAPVVPLAVARDEFIKAMLQHNKDGSNVSTISEMRGMMTVLETRARRDGLPESEISGTYREITRVLQSERVKELCPPLKLAREILQNSATPTRIDQGNHPTCNVNSYECKLYAQQPSVAARVVASVATTREFVCADGTVIKPRSIMPDTEAKQFVVKDGERNFASQIFQNTAINIYWNRQEMLPDLTNVGRGNIQYCQSEGKEGEPEYLVDCSKNPPKIFSMILDGKDSSKTTPRIGQEKISDINAQITGKPTQDLGIERGITTRVDEGKGINYVSNIEDFKATLERLAAEKKFPVLLSVDAAMPPFSDGAKAETSYRPHLVTVVSYDPVHGVHVDNQWGSASDHSGAIGQQPLVPVQVLFDSMRTFAPKSAGRDLGEYFSTRLKSTTWTDVRDSGLNGLTASLAFRGVTGTMAADIRHSAYYGFIQRQTGGYAVYDTIASNPGRSILRGSTAGTSLLAAAVFTGVPQAYGKSLEEGNGKLLRSTMDAVSYEAGMLGTYKTLGMLTKNRLVPGRYGAAVVVGMGAAALMDRSLGEIFELGGRVLTKVGRDLVSGRSPELP